jgi:hypothetical protein
MPLWARADRDITNLAPWLSYRHGNRDRPRLRRVGDYQYAIGALLDQLWVH